MNVLLATFWYKASVCLKKNINLSRTNKNVCRFFNSKLLYYLDL